jgi:hypothetical protein
MKTRCGCNTHGFGPKTMCDSHSSQLRRTAGEQTRFAYKWFTIAERYMQECKCDGSCDVCQDFAKAIKGE